MTEQMCANFKKYYYFCAFVYILVGNTRVVSLLVVGWGKEQSSVITNKTKTHHFALLFSDDGYNFFFTADDCLLLI